MPVQQFRISQQRRRYVPVHNTGILIVNTYDILIMIEDFI